MKCPISVAAAISLAAVCVSPLQAQTKPAPPKKAISDTRFETLRPESAFGDWRRLALEGGSRPNEAGFGYGRTLAGDPLGLNAPEYTGGYWQPLSQRLSSLVETSVAPGALGGSERSVFGQLGTQLGAGWGMQAGIRRSEVGPNPMDWTNSFTSGGLGLTALPPIGGTLGAGLGMVTVERFWDHYRGAYTLASGRADGGSSATSHRVQLDYFYTPMSSVGLSYTTGRSFDNGFGLNTLTPVEANNVGLIGEHWFSRSWAVNYNALLGERGTEGIKPELRLGLRLRF